MKIKIGCLAASLLTFGTILHAAAGPGSLAIVCSEGSTSDCDTVAASMMATGRFTSADTFNANTATPALAAISGYGYLLAWTNTVPADGTALGNLLASYYALGGKHMTISTYAFSPPWQIGGTLATGAYAGLTNAGPLGSVSGNLVAVAPSDPILAGGALTGVTYAHNSNYAHPALAAGATLLATDGAGVNMIARSANGIVDINMYPGPDPATNQAFYSLVALTLTVGPSAIPAVTPFAVALLAAAILGLAVYAMRRQTA